MESVEEKVGHQTILVGRRSSHDSKLPVTLASHHLHLKNFHESSERDQMAMKQNLQIKQMITRSYIASCLTLVGCASILGPSLDAGRRASIAGDHEEVIQNLKPFADKQKGWVAGALGESLYATAKTDDDYREALRHLLNAEATGYDSGRHLIGKMYALGQGVQKDYFVAAKWFDRYHRATGIRPDWSLLSGLPSTGYAEEQYQYANSLRPKNDTWLPLKTINEVYGCCDHIIPAERISSAHLNIYDLYQIKKPEDGDLHFFDENGRRIKAQLVLDGEVGWTKNYSYGTQNESIEEILRKEKSTDTTKISINNHGYFYDSVEGDYSNKCTYRNEGGYYLEACESAWGSSKSDKIEYKKYNPATGELVGWGEAEYRCKYQADYSRICTDTFDGKVSEQTQYSPRGWLLSEISYAYCRNGEIKLIYLKEAAYEGEDSHGNWKKMTYTYKVSKVNNTCSSDMYQVGELPNQLDYDKSTVYERSIVYR